VNMPFAFKVDRRVLRPAGGAQHHVYAVGILFGRLGPDDWRYSIWINLVVDKTGRMWKFERDE